MKTLYRTTERATLEQAEKALKKAKGAFNAAYPRKQGKAFPEGKEFLVQAEKQVARLRRKVKGY